MHTALVLLQRVFALVLSNSSSVTIVSIIVQTVRYLCAHAASVLVLILLFIYYETSPKKDSEMSGTVKRLRLNCD